MAQLGFAVHWRKVVSSPLLSHEFVASRVSRATTAATRTVIAPRESAGRSRQNLPPPGGTETCPSLDVGLLLATPPGCIKMTLTDKLAKLRIEVAHDLFPGILPLDKASRPSRHAPA